MQASVVASRPRHIHRLAVSASFLLQGLCFSTWASRIPTVQQKLHLSETELGGVLLAVPVGLIASLPITGWLVAKHGSRTMTVLAVLLYSGALPLLGLAQNVPQLLAALVLFGFGSNMANISVNTQGVGVEAIYGKSILATFHGIWSLAGFVGAALGTAMIGWGISPLQHFTGMALFIWLGVALMRPYLVPADAPSPADQPLFVLPDKGLMLLGVLAFCSLLSEGTMFDWK
jgi:MFS family permease